ncbi:hypothetical protein FHS18_002476 [Paenibacillus phyllosphaerae]|uniref:Uncharacterized protein n=1 Tax=Paenibacillus phyllosphaerae TaxID=274593 RepID=A0A7W5AXQ9_9BACL|nr:hypothetical protein [Paenibacillus phyllosphaerae]
MFVIHSYCCLSCHTYHPVLKVTALLLVLYLIFSICVQIFFTF